ncbi:protein CHUP1, chloroplastic isoform X2 [Canna indica]|uniref:Protein CHUP1, chloroplastic isoform X2 n=1 Tax=Canna indica TaxID=4628 RepID=A0AAQ3K6Y0_9LILI|nr:protein CHUP1, chloroplastic isoform X2 [Canna indica]
MFAVGRILHCSTMDDVENKKNQPNDSHDLEAAAFDPKKVAAMKQELPAADCKASSPLPAAARARHSRARETPRTDSATANGASPGLKARPKPASLDSTSATLARRPIQFNKIRAAVSDVGVTKERNHENGRVAGNRVVEQYARLRRRAADANWKASEDGANAKTKELQNRAEESERLVREMQSEVSAQKDQIEKLQLLNVELELQNKKLQQDLAAAESKIKTLEKPDKMESFSKSRIRDVMELVQKNSAEQTTEMRIGGDNIYKIKSSLLKPTTKSVEVQSKVVIKKPVSSFTTSQAPVTGPPPPPPPPPPSAPPHKALGRATVNKASALVELYHSLTKRDGKQSSMSNGGCAPLSNNVHGIVGELQHRSTHLLAIKADVETKGDFIKHLIEKVRTASFTDMEDVLTFVDWLDGELSTLADERAVLKHFDWPEKKADALREAAFEFRDLKRLEAQVSSFKDDTSVPCDSILKKISNLLDKLEQSVSRLIKLKNTNVLLYRECKIPTDWMLDSGMVSKMKQVSVKLARVYIGRVSTELEWIRNSERESAQEALLFQGVRFAYRAHQFAGGLDSELMLTIEKLKRKVESQGGRGQ